jgi:hypothetical protein
MNAAKVVEREVQRASGPKMRNLLGKRIRWARETAIRIVQ